jgi:ABC-type sugar transport system permease subunit
MGGADDQSRNVITAGGPGVQLEAGGPGRWSRHSLAYGIYLEIAGVTLVAPAIFFLTLVVAGPFVYVVWESLFPEGSHKAGLGAYRWFFRADFWPTLEHGLVITGGSVAVEVLLALPLALLLNQRLPGRGILRGLVTLPWAVPTIAVSTAFLWLADPFYGLFNQLAESLGLIRQPIALIGDPRWAIWAVTAATAWKGLPLVFIVLLSALQSLEPQYLEAARVDGAPRWAQLRFIILPHMRSSIELAVVLSAVYNFALLDFVYLLTGGGPAGLTTNWPLLLYNQAFLALDTGRAAAVGVAIFIAGVVALVTVLSLDGLRRRRYYA